MTGLLRLRYQMLRNLQIPPSLALEFARDSLTAYPSSTRFARALAELREMLVLHFGHGMTPEQIHAEYRQSPPEFQVGNRYRSRNDGV